eukprot:1160224-Pelagomonas_calceolata.AAC.19
MATLASSTARVTTLRVVTKTITATQLCSCMQVLGSRHASAIAQSPLVVHAGFYLDIQKVGVKRDTHPRASYALAWS